MKKNFIYGLFAAAALVSAAACSNDSPIPGEGDGSSNEDGVYMTVNFDLPTSTKGSRSYTDGDNSSNNGEEIGSDKENKVQDVVMVLAKKDYSYIASAEIASNNITPVGTSGRSYKSTTVFSKTQIFQYYDNNSASDNTDIYVFVFCNPTNTLKKTLEDANFGDSEWYNAIGKYDPTDANSEIIWADNSFLMGNSALAVRTLPATKADWDNYITESSPFNLSGMNSFGRPNEVDNYTNKGNVMVERTAARFDFRDGSVDGISNPDYNGIGDQTYQVLLDSNGKPFVNVKLGKMSLVNMNKKFYFLKRVSPTGFPVNISLCGAELPWYSNAFGAELSDDGNYVVDAEAETKNQKPLPNNYSFNTFNYPFFDESGKVDNADTGKDRWGTSVIANILAGQDDNSSTWNPNNTLPHYKVWRYATENTIPKEVENQKNGVSTGVVFKGQLLPARGPETTDDDATEELLNALKIIKGENQSGMDEPKLYLYAGHLYCGWANIRQMALSLAISDLKKVGDTWQYTVNRSGALYNAVFGTGGFGTVTYKYTDGGTTTSIELKDTPAEDTNSANYKYKAWQDDNDNVNYQAFKAAVVASKITIYERSYDKDLDGWGYYCYYYYWNQHNNNGQPGVMGPMEFAVVRNNVYKLAVTKIARLGHPRIAANDPETPNPNTPDEKADIYLTVSCTTLPWVVRLNDIEF